MQTHRREAAIDGGEALEDGKAVMISAQRIVKAVLRLGNVPDFGVSES